MIQRYTIAEIGEIWEDKAKFDIWLKIEITACEAMNKLGLVPDDALREIKAKAKYNISRINEIEKVTVRVDTNNWQPIMADFTRSEPIIMDESQCIYYNNGKVLKECINQTSIASVGNMRCCI